MKNLNIYNAKPCGKSIEEHNLDLYNIANQIEDIYNINEENINKLKKCIKFHDIGKAVASFQDDMTTVKKRIMRHEILSASADCLDDSERLAIITHHKEIKQLTEYIEKECYESEVNELSEKIDIKLKDIRSFIKKLNRSNSMVKDLDNILLKGYLQYCDHVGSAGIKTIEKGFYAKDIFKFNKYNSIQEEVLKLTKKEDILIIGPTGVGKTATSLFWSDFMQNENKSKRIYYILPYTASINSLYKDMLEKGISVSMLHNKAEYFLESLDLDNSKEIYNLFKKSVKQLNICTIYQIVKAIFSCKRFEMLLAQLKNSIFIIDEIHCFDVEQLAMLISTLKFLKDKLGISICIMSASISSNIQKIIQDELNINKVILAHPRDYKIRHKINRINKTIIEDIDKIEKDLNDNKKVLICVNTVSQAQELYLKLKQYNPKMIHGRYNMVDRAKAEEGIKESKLLIGTQAIEVSLDISYDVLYTEICPFDSLLQRLGRVNRNGENHIANIYIYNNINNYIYQENIINKTDVVLSEIINIDNSVMLEGKMQYYLDKVYNEFDKELYLSICERVNHLINNLKLGTYNKEAINDICYSNTISVLPEILLSKYIHYIDNKEYLKAKALLVNIHKCKSHFNKITFDKAVDTYITTYKYDEAGLHFTE